MRPFEGRTTRRDVLQQHQIAKKKKLRKSFESKRNNPKRRLKVSLKTWRKAASLSAYCKGRRESIAIGSHRWRGRNRQGKRIFA